MSFFLWQGNQINALICFSSLAILTLPCPSNKSFSGESDIRQFQNNPHFGLKGRKRRDQFNFSFRIMFFFIIFVIYLDGKFACGCDMPEGP